jgi:hypothetical protein
MNSFLILTRVTAGLSPAALFILAAIAPAAAGLAQDGPAGQYFAVTELAEPPTDAAGCLLAVQQASDPATAEDAYQRGIDLGADRLAMNQAYMREMINLGLPGQAEDAAEQILDVYPQDGVAWAVLAYADAARNDTTAALAEMATAVDLAPDDAFVMGVAGKLMAWYLYPGLGDPSELPDDLAARLGEIHAQLSTREAYRVAFEAAYAYYQSQASVPLPEYPQEVVEPAFEDIAYNPDLCTSYNEYAYSGFTVPCFSVSWVVPRVRCYVVHDRPVYGHLRFHIGDRCGRYHSRLHARRLNWNRITRCVAYHVAERIRLASRPGRHLAPVRARYTRAMFTSRPAGSRSGATDSPQPIFRRLARLFSGRTDRGHSGHTRATAPAAGHRTDSTPRSTDLWPRTRGSSAQADRTSRRPRSAARGDSKSQAGPTDQRRSRLGELRQHQQRVKTKGAVPRSEPREGSSPRRARERDDRANLKAGHRPRSAAHSADRRPQTRSASRHQSESQPAGRSHKLIGTRRKPQPSAPAAGAKVRSARQPRADVSARHSKASAHSSSSHGGIKRTSRRSRPPDPRRLGGK